MYQQCSRWECLWEWATKGENAWQRIEHSEVGGGEKKKNMRKAESNYFVVHEQCTIDLNGFVHCGVLNEAIEKTQYFPWHLRLHLSQTVRRRFVWDPNEFLMSQPATHEINFILGESSFLPVAKSGGYRYLTHLLKESSPHWQYPQWQIQRVSKVLNVW